MLAKSGTVQTLTSQKEIRSGKMSVALQGLKIQVVRSWRVILILVLGVLMMPRGLNTIKERIDDH